MSYRDVVIGSARAQLTNPNAHNQAVAWFQSVAQIEHDQYGYRGYSPTTNDKWCAIFVSWCAAQAGILNFINPFECGTHEMRDIYNATGRYLGATAAPTHGDVVFLDTDGDGVLNHVGFLISTGATTLHTIEGNVSGPSNGVIERDIPFSWVIGYGNNIVSPTFYRGYLDSATNTLIHGWAWNGYNDDFVRVKVSIHRGINEIAQANVLANNYRADLAAAGIGNGRHAYSYNTNFYALYGPGVYTIRVYMITGGNEVEVMESGKVVYVSVANAAGNSYLEVVREEVENRIIVDNKIETE